MDDKKIKLYEDIIGYSLNCFEFYIAENYLIIYTAKNDFNSVSKVLKI